MFRVLLIAASLVSVVLAHSNIALIVQDEASFSASDWNERVTAYESVLNNSVIVPQDGTVSITVWINNANRFQEVVPLTQIDNVTVHTLAPSLRNFNRSSIVEFFLTRSQQAQRLSSLNSFPNIATTRFSGVHIAANGSTSSQFSIVRNRVTRANCVAIRRSIKETCKFLHGENAMARAAYTPADLKGALEVTIKDLAQPFVCNRTCANNGTLDAVTCTCQCLSPWAGDTCQTSCPNVWSQYTYTPEQWTLSAQQPTLNPITYASSAANAYLPRDAVYHVSPDGHSLYVSGGAMKTSQPFLNVFRRYPDGSNKLLQSLNAAFFGVSTLSVGDVAVSPDNQNVYAVIFSHVSTTATASLAVMARTTNNTEEVGKLRLLQVISMPNVVTHHLQAFGQAPSIVVKCSPDSQQVVVGSQLNAAPYTPVLKVFNRVYTAVNVTSITCVGSTSQWHSSSRVIHSNQESYEYITVRQPYEPNPCDSLGLTCDAGVCKELVTDGQVSLAQELTGFAGYSATDVLFANDERFVYFSTLGYADSSLTGSFGVRGNSVAVLQRYANKTYTIVQRNDAPASSDYLNVMVFMSPSQRLFYTVTERTLASAGDRNFSVQSRSALDGKLSSPLTLRSFGPCDYSTSWHPRRICATNRFVFVQSTLASGAPAGSSPANTSLEVYEWEDFDNCPFNAGNVSKLLQFVGQIRDPAGVYDVSDMACSEDYAYLGKSGVTELLSVVPRDLRTKFKEPITNHIVIIKQPITLRSPIARGGDIVFYTTPDGLPQGLTLNNLTGEITGIPTQLTLKTKFTVGGVNFRGDSTTSDLYLTVVDDPVDRCRQYEPEPAKETQYGLTIRMENGYFWLSLLLLLLFLLLCCFYTHERRRTKKHAAAIPAATTQHVHHHHEERPDEVDGAGPMIKPKKDRAAHLDKFNKAAPVQLRLRPSGDRDIFIFGTRRVQMSIINGKLMVRVGGGWMPVNQFVEKNAPIEARKMGLDPEQALELTRVGKDLERAERQIKRNLGQKGGGARAVKTIRQESRAKLIESNSAESIELEQVHLDAPRLSMPLPTPEQKP